MPGCGRRITALAALLSIVAPVVQPRTASARSPERVTPDAQVDELIERAEVLLSKVEYERARAVLERAVADPELRNARPANRARLWAALGRTRAELGVPGSEQAFRQAVQLDRHVRLPRTTSPKIAEALERTRATLDPAGGGALPAPGRRGAVPGAPGAPPAAGPPANLRDGQPPAAAGPAGAPTSAPPPGDPGAAPPEGRQPSAPDGAPALPANPAEPEERSVRLPPDRGPYLRYRLAGQVGVGRTVTLVVELQRGPRSPTFELAVRRNGGDFVVEHPPASSNGFARLVVFDRPHVELYVRAYRGKKLIAEMGSPAAPVTLSAVPGPPSLLDAWSVAATSTRAAERAGLVGPAPRATTSTVVPGPIASSSSDAITIAGVTAGGAILVAGIVVLYAVLHGGKGPCHAKEGFGCTEVTVSPLARF